MLQKDAKSIWQEEVRDLAVDVAKNCKTDNNLTYFLESMITKVDGDVLVNRPFHDRLEGVSKVLSSTSYYVNAHKTTDPDEVKKIKDFASKLLTLTNISEYELKTHTPEVEEVVEVKRLPNTQATIESVYGVAPNKKERIR